MSVDLKRFDDFIDRVVMMIDLLQNRAIQQSSRDFFYTKRICAVLLMNINSDEITLLMTSQSYFLVFTPIVQIAKKCSRLGLSEGSTCVSFYLLHESPNVSL